MIFYLIILFLSLGGMFVILLRQREAFAAFNFAEFMENLQTEAGSLWHTHLREHSFVLLEKILQKTRILFLKMESRLFKILHSLRGIKEKNGNGHLPE